MATILIVEDDQTILRLLQTLLELEGYEVLIGRRKEQIFHILSQEIPDLVILDVHLWAKEGQKSSGYEVLEYIRRTPGLEHTQILMTSGMDLRQQALKAGADDFLLKPYIPEELVNSIRSVLG